MSTARTPCSQRKTTTTAHSKYYLSRPGARRNGLSVISTSIAILFCVSLLLAGVMTVNAEEEQHQAAVAPIADEAAAVDEVEAGPEPLIFFDLDNTLYPASAGVDEQMKERIKVRPACLMLPARC